MKLTHSLWSAVLFRTVELLGLQQSLTACADGHETSCYRVIFERLLFSTLFIAIESLFPTYKEYYNVSFSVIAYLSCTTLLLSTQAMHLF